jgi:hypothetical protein
MYLFSNLVFSYLIHDNEIHFVSIFSDSNKYGSLMNGMVGFSALHSQNIHVNKRHQLVV